jgi:thiamine transport system substrate-binding protein
MLAALIIYAYSSFAASWGPGPAIINEFKKQCGCEVKLIDIGDGGGLISRLKLEGKNTKVDVLIGLDQNSLEKISGSELGWKTKSFEFDYGPLAFVYNSTVVMAPPTSLDDLLDPKWKGQILLEDPRLSTTGMGFLLWVIKEKGEDGAWKYFRALKDQIKMTTPSWDLAYGLFKKGQGQLVFSYWTSPAYHIQEENRHDIKAAAFKNGNYIQKEFMMAAPGEKNSELKKKFLDFMLGDFVQKILPEKNFMYPVKKVTLPKAFKEIGPVKELPSLSPSPGDMDRWLKKWREIFA